MRKSGLHKQIAFIFEGDPSSESPAKEPFKVTQGISEGKTLNPAGGVSRGGSLSSERMVSRLKPLPRVKIAAEPNLLKKFGGFNQKKKPNSSEASSANRRQKTMTIMVGALSLVFMGVMALSFGGLGQTKAASSLTAASTGTPNTPPQFAPESWVFPDPLPEQMRNPLVIPKVQSLAGEAGSTEAGAMAITGIVFSDSKPSVIIDGEVVLEGQAFKGVNVVKVMRGEVEFEKDGKHWTQRVR